MKKTIKIILSILILIILIILLMYKGTFSSFIAKINGSSETQVAEPIFVMENTDKKILDDEHTELDYYFTIKNFNSNNVRTQTDLKYYIEIQPKVDDTIILTLYRDNTIIPLNNQRTNYIDLGNASNITHSYRLHVKYDRDRNDSTEDIKENIFIKAYAVQS